LRGRAARGVRSPKAGGFSQESAKTEAARALQKAAKSRRPPMLMSVLGALAALFIIVVVTGSWMYYEAKDERLKRLAAKIR
jgi:hypothetical protein